ncbi:MAG: HAMP domain-containing histidine kinase [Clostridia bacterium]|nr:HAMP domain-containing histidine kinase [Clostridia bacterium]
MKKSIFIKYFSITAAILFVSFTIFSSILIVFSRNQWVTEKNNLLTKNVQLISDVSSKTLGTPEFKPQTFTVISIIAQTVDADIYIVDAEGKNVLCSDESQDSPHKKTTISKTIMSQALKGKFSEVGSMSGLYSQNCYTVGTPIYYNDQTVGAVFASVPSADLDYYLNQTFKLILICALIVIVMAFIAIYIASAQMTRPLRLMAQAARNMEKGDFLMRIPVYQRDEVGQLAEAFNKMSKSLASLEQMRRSFISSVSHELKTPMTTISGFVDGILDGTIKPDDQGRYLRIVSDETKRLSRLVNSMLQLSKLESEEAVLSPVNFNVTDMLVRIMLSFEQKIESKGIEIRGLEEISQVDLFADKDMIYQVIYNLIENAIKFTPENGYIYVKVQDDNHGNVNIHIKNSGAGLSEMELNRIFERFYKTDRSRSEDKTGMGFGLYIVKTIVGLHGGKISASSVVNEYTCFDVSLPSIPVQIVNN